MSEVEVERIGGLAGMGGPGARVKSFGRVDVATLSDKDRTALDALFDKSYRPGAPKPDVFRYRITRKTARGKQSVEVPEDDVPKVLQDSVRDVLE